jgi:exonuclease SbcD
VLCVDVQAGQAAQITPLLIPRAVAMLRIPSQHAAPLEDIITELQQLGVAAVEHPDQRAWLEVVVLLDGPAPLDLRQQVEAHVPKDRVRLVRLRHEQQSRQTDDATSAHALLPEDLPAPQQLFERVWEQHYASPDRAVYADFAHLLQVLEQEEQP